MHRTRRKCSRFQFKMELRLIMLVLCSLLVNRAFTCQDPFPVGTTKEILETEPNGTVVLNLGPSTGRIWSLSVRQPASHSNQLARYFSVDSDQVNPIWLAVLDKPLDLEQIFNDYGIELETITLDLSCTDQSTGRKVPYSGVIAVTPVSEFVPVFLPRALTQQVPEDAEINSVLFDLRPMVSDDDVYRGSTDIDRFDSYPFLGSLPDGQGMFDVAADGKVRLLRDLDFDAGERTFSLNVTVTDLGGLSSTANLRIDVQNVNDNPPVFDFSGCSGEDCALTEYKATVEPGFTGELTSIIPNNIMADDPDSDPVFYRFISGSLKNFSSYLQINSATGVVTFSQAVGDLRVGHLSVTVEAMDVSPTSPANSSPTSSDYNSATCVLLVLVSGRETEFPAVIGQSGDSDDRDSLFISTVCLATLCVVVLILLLVMVVWLCCLRRERRKADMANGQAECSHTLKDRRNPMDDGALMRSVHSDSERRFIRELSQTAEAGGNDNWGFQQGNGHVQNPGTSITGRIPTDNDVFVTDMESFYSLQGILNSPQRTALTATPELIAFQDALSLSLQDTDSAGGDLSRQNNGMMDIPRDQSGDTQLLNPRNLQSQYRAIDLLTSVAPFEENESNSKPFSSFLRHGQLREITPASSSAGTCRSVRSMRDVDVISELEDLMTGTRSSSPASASSPPPLPPHMHGYLPDQPDSTLEEAVTPFPSSPSTNVTAPSFTISPNQAVGVSSAAKPTSVNGNNTDVSGRLYSGQGLQDAVATPENRVTSSIHLVPEFSLTKTDPSSIETTGLSGGFSGASTSEHSLGFKPSQPNEYVNSSISSANPNFFTVSL